MTEVQTPAPLPTHEDAVAPTEAPPAVTATTTTGESTTVAPIPAVPADPAPAPGVDAEKKVAEQPTTTTTTTAAAPTTAPASRSVASDKLPSEDVLKIIYDLDVVDKDKKAVKFGTLVKDTPNRRNLIVFIRHFFCGYCQEYIRALARDLPPSKLAALPTPTTLTIIGCGDAKMIPGYVKETNCPYEIYADATRKIYTQLGLVTSLAASKKKPEYIGVSFLQSTFAGIKQGLKAGLEGRKAGKISQNGGELIWIDGELRFIHRMRDTTSHMEIKDLETVLA